jgi:hypothetical protein
MADNLPTTCQKCGKPGLVYRLGNRFYCPSCLREKRPPLSYRGPERRRRLLNTTGFTRRSSDLAHHR